MTILRKTFRTRSSRLYALTLYPILSEGLIGLPFRRSVKILPGVRLNFSASGMSTTVGPRGASINLGPRGAHLNVGLPGYRDQLPDGSERCATPVVSGGLGLGRTAVSPSGCRHSAASNPALAGGHRAVVT